MKRTIKDWLIVIVSLSDDVAITLLVLLVLWWLKVPITLPVIVFLALFFAGSTFLIHKLAIPALHRKKAVGAECMVGLEGMVIEPLVPVGTVRVRNECWKAKSVGRHIAAGKKVEVVGIAGLTLMVKLKKRSLK